MTVLIIPSAPKSTEQVIVDAFALLKCERWGGPSEAGWSRLADVLRCPYRYYLKHVRRVGVATVGNSSPALDIGSFVHMALAAHYAARLPPPYSDDGATLVYPGYRDFCPSVEQVFEALRAAGADPEALARAQNLWDGYIDHWGEDGIQPVAVEMLAGDPRLHTSRYDMVFTVVDGVHDGLWIGEHKTASSSSDLEAWQLDGEIIGEAYSWQLSRLQDVFGEPLRGIMINMLIKSKVPQYRRIWQRVDWNVVQDYAQHRWHWFKVMEGYQRDGYWPRSHYGCHARFGRCAFWDHCATLSESFLIPIEPAADKT